jgi:hypothetical protein
MYDLEPLDCFLFENKMFQMQTYANKTPLETMIQSPFNLNTLHLSSQALSIASKLVPISVPKRPGPAGLHEAGPDHR